MTDAKQLFAKLQNDKIFTALLEKVPQDMRDEAIKAIKEIVEMGADAGAGLTVMTSKVKSEMKQGEDLKQTEVVKDA